MGTYLSPGVYIEEQDTGPEPIEGVSTSVTGFVGVTQKGPLDANPPVLVTSFPEYQRVFGGYFTPTFGQPTDGDSYNLLPHAVAGFFNNGGQLLYIKRVGANPLTSTPPQLAVVATTGLENGAGAPTQITRLTQTASPGVLTLYLSSTRGIQNGTTLLLTQSKNGITSTGNATVQSYNDATGQVNLTAPLPAPVPAAANYDSQYTTVALNSGAAYNVVADMPNEFQLAAANPGAWGNTQHTGGGTGIVLQITPSSRAQAQFIAPGVTGGNVLSLNSASNLYAGAIVEISTGGSYTIPGTSTVGFIPGEVVKQAGTGASANVVGTVPANGPLIVGTISGGPANNAGVWTGQTSNATFTPNAAPVASGTNFVITGTGSVGFTSNESVEQSAAGGATATVVGPVPEAGPMTITALAGVPNASTWVDAAGAVFTPTGPPALVSAFLGKVYAKVASISGNSITLTAALPAAAVTAINANVGFTPPVPVTVRSCEFDINDSYDNTTESFRGLTLDNTTPYYFADAIINGSSLLSVPYISGVLPPTLPSDQVSTNPGTMPVAPDGLNVLLTGGTDGACPLPSDFAGNDGGPGNRTGIAALVDAAEVSIIAAPGITDQTTQMALITQCENLKYRFAILDPSPTPTAGPPTMTTIQAQRDLYDTYYAAIYFPRVVVSDPLSGNPLPVAPSGHMAGIYAQTDASRGVWKAPANIVINGILSLETKLSKGDQDILNPEPNNINALRDFTAQGRGLRVYGARCITTDTEWMYINVRRLFIFLEASLDQGTQWAVFEPNDQTLWNRLIQSVSAFLTTIWQQGGLMGATADQAFFVKCGLDTMSSDDIENGRLIMLVGVAPVFPAEFVIIRIGQWAGGSSVQVL